MYDLLTENRLNLNLNLNLQEKVHNLGNECHLLLEVISGSSELTSFAAGDGSSIVDRMAPTVAQH